MVKKKFILVTTAYIQLPKCLILTAELMYQGMNLLTHRKIEIIHRLEHLHWTRQFARDWRYVGQHGPYPHRAYGLWGKTDTNQINTNIQIDIGEDLEYIIHLSVAVKIFFCLFYATYLDM